MFSAGVRDTSVLLFTAVHSFVTRDARPVVFNITLYPLIFEAFPTDFVVKVKQS